MEKKTHPRIQDKLSGVESSQKSPSIKVWRLSSCMTDEMTTGWRNVFHHPFYQVTNSRSKKNSKSCSKPQVTQHVVDRLHVGGKTSALTKWDSMDAMTGFVDEEFNYCFSKPCKHPSSRSSSISGQDHFSSDLSVCLSDYEPEWKSRGKESSSWNDLSLSNNADKPRDCVTTNTLSMLELLTLPSRKRLQQKKMKSKSHQSLGVHQSSKSYLPDGMTNTSWKLSAYDQYSHQFGRQPQATSSHDITESKLRLPLKEYLSDPRSSWYWQNSLPNNTLCLDGLPGHPLQERRHKGIIQPSHPSIPPPWMKGSSNLKVKGSSPEKWNLKIHHTKPHL